MKLSKRTFLGLTLGTALATVTAYCSGRWLAAQEADRFYDHGWCWRWG
jgi:hypothetical protein